MNDPALVLPIFLIVIVSPHRDDAAFSCGIGMTLFLRHSIAVTILNIFTISDYAPYTRAGSSVAEITAIRRSEDEALLHRLGPGIAMRDLAELDAPLRLHISEHAVVSDPLPTSRFKDEVLRLTPRL